MTLGAMLTEQLLAYPHGPGVAVRRVRPQAGLLGHVLELAVVESSACGRVLCAATDQDCRKRQPGREPEKEHSALAHRSFSHTRLTCSPKPLNSCDNPQRSSRRWLSGLSPNPGENRTVHPDGRFQATAA